MDGVTLLKRIVRACRRQPAGTRAYRVYPNPRWGYSIPESLDRWSPPVRGQDAAQVVKHFANLPGWYFAEKFQVEVVATGEQLLYGRDGKLMERSP